MHKFKLLLKDFSGKTSSQSSKLEFVDNYYLYRQSNGGGVVDEFNVKTFLDDSDNAVVAKNFFSYLTGNTNTEQFKEIFYNDKKLSNVFNSYYNTSVVTNVGTSTSVINLELTGTTAITATEYYRNWDGHVTPHVLLTGTPMSIQGDSINIVSEQQLISITSEDSYYVPITISLEHELIGQMNFSEYAMDYVVSGKTITQGFVDINKKTDASEYWTTLWEYPDTLSGGTAGLMRSSFTGVYDQMPNFSKLSPLERVVVPIPEQAIPSSSNYVYRFNGYFNALTTDVYTFYLSSDDGSILWIGDNLLIKNDGLHGAREYSGQTSMVSGYHKIDLQFFQRDGGDILQFSYSNSTIPKTVVPASLFSH